LQEFDDTNVSHIKKKKVKIHSADDKVLKIAGLQELDMADEAWEVIHEAFKKSTIINHWEVWLKMFLPVMAAKSCFLHLLYVSVTRQDKSTMFPFKWLPSIQNSFFLKIQSNKNEPYEKKNKEI